MLNRNTDPVYNFFCNQIGKADYDIRTTRMQINALAKKQTEHKRGKAYLVDMRRKYIESKDPKAKRIKSSPVQRTTIVSQKPETN
jgi:hypothetical protein